MTLPNVPGSLSKILNQFYLQGLDLVKLESRPIQDGSFDVAFYVDFKGNLMDRSIAAFLNELCKNCQDFKLLGTFGKVIIIEMTEASGATIICLEMQMKRV